MFIPKIFRIPVRLGQLYFQIDCRKTSRSSNRFLILKGHCPSFHSRTYLAVSCFGFLVFLAEAFHQKILAAF